MGNTPDWVDFWGNRCNWYELNDWQCCEVMDTLWTGEVGPAIENCCYCFLNSRGDTSHKDEEGMPFKDVLIALELPTKGIIPDDITSLSMSEGRTPKKNGMNCSLV
jgi:hypothetical protein